MTNDEVSPKPGQVELSDVAAKMAGSAKDPDGYLRREVKPTEEQKRKRDIVYIATKLGLFN